MKTEKMRTMLTVSIVLLAAAVVNAGLISQYKFEGNADDSIGTNNGTLMAGATTTIDPERGEVLTLDGVDDYVMIGDRASLELQEFSMSFWDQLNNPSGLYQGGIAKGYVFGTPYQFSYRMDFHNGYLRGGIANTANVAFGRFEDYIPVGDSNWHMWTMTVGNWSIAFYKDGVLEDINSYTGTIDYTKSHNNFIIGARDGGNYSFNGSIDDVRIYDLALDAVEVESLYQDGLLPEPEFVTYHVNGTTGDNTNDGLTPETAVATIQRGINMAQDGDTVLVWPGVYTEELFFRGKAITVKSAADAAVIQTLYGYAASFYFGEGPETVLKNFVIRDSEYGIYLGNGSSPTLENLTIVNNDFGISAFDGSDPTISNCIFWDNIYGDLFDCTAQYSFIEESFANLAAYWKLNGDATDTFGNNDGTVYGNPVWATGQVDGGLDFDGIDDWVEIASDDSLNFL